MCCSCFVPSTVTLSSSASVMALVPAIGRVVSCIVGRVAFAAIVNNAPCSINASVAMLTAWPHCNWQCFAKCRVQSCLWLSLCTCCCCCTHCNAATVAVSTAVMALTKEQSPLLPVLLLLLLMLHQSQSICDNRPWCFLHVHYQCVNGNTDCCNWQ